MVAALNTVCAPISQIGKMLLAALREHVAIAHEESDDR